MKMPTGFPDLQALYEQTLALSAESHTITGSLVWVEQILPLFALACRVTLTRGSIKTIDRWLHWIDSDPVLLEQAGKGSLLRWRQEGLRLLLTATRALKRNSGKRTDERRHEIAEDLWKQHDTFSPCFPRAFWHDLADFLCTPDSYTVQQHQTPHEMHQVWFPLVLSEPVVDGGIETNVIVAEFALSPARGMSGGVFLHPEQAVVRCLDTQFARSFELAALVARQNLGRSAEGLPDVRVRILTVNPGHERFLAGGPLQGPSGAGALALALHSLYSGERRSTDGIAVSFALAGGEEQRADGACHAVAATPEKIRGCARMGVKSLLVAKESQDRLARYGHIQGVEVFGAATFTEAVDLLRGLTTTGLVRSATAARKITLLYKRRGDPDELVSKMLLTQLSNRGCEVFIDRHLPIGIRWAQEIERQIRTADAVIPLLSESAVQSEMFQYEIETARQAAETHGGHPLILPVRVRFDGLLPEPLAAILNPIQSASWESDADNARLIEQIVGALENPAAARPWTDRASLEPPFGVVPLDSRFYIERTADEEFSEALARRDSIILVRGPRQIGKTSLLARGLRQAGDTGTRVVWTDLQKLSAAQLASPEALYRTLTESLAEQLDLDMSPESAWTTLSGPNVNFERYVKREALGKRNTPLLWGLDEVDRLFDCAFKDEIFGLFRAWHNQRAFDPTGAWGRLSLVMAYATEAHLFITDLNQSPFNVGTRLTLQDFTPAQTAELNHRYGSPLRDIELKDFTALLGGNPYLVRRGFHEMRAHGLTLESLLESSDQEDGPFGDHLHRLLASLAQSLNLLEVMRCVLRGEPCASDETFYRLRSAGIVSGKSAKEIRCRCLLYERYLRRHIQ